eukprot:m.66612 g.66612  ORF g.66612 m.66612 type:complete len:121 (-) comp7627_c0_seq3:95-457(-)
MRHLHVEAQRDRQDSISTLRVGNWAQEKWPSPSLLSPRFIAVAALAHNKQNLFFYRVITENGAHKLVAHDELEDPSPEEIAKWHELATDPRHKLGKYFCAINSDGSFRPNSSLLKQFPDL